MKKFPQFVSMLVLMILVLSACGPTSAAAGLPTESPTRTLQPAQTQSDPREAQVQSVEIQFMQTDPVQVNAIVRGHLTESCATFADTQLAYASRTFMIKLLTVSLHLIGAAPRPIHPLSKPFRLTRPVSSQVRISVVANGVSAVFSQPTDRAAPTAVPTAAPTPVPTAAPTAVPTAIPTATSAPAAAGCQDSAQYITDDGLDGTTYAPNTPFTKTWTLKNTGTCTWDSRYMVFQISGTYMTQQPGYWIVPQGQTVAPGQTVNISVGMTSPVENGSYKSYWGLKKRDGAVYANSGRREREFVLRQD